jgi:hypothetical protein
MKELQEAYVTLKKHAIELEKAFEESQVLHDVEAFETTVLEEETTKEVNAYFNTLSIGLKNVYKVLRFARLAVQLGIAGAVVLGLTVLHASMKAVLPVKVATPVLGGAWILGGAFVAFRLTAGTVAGWVASTERNARRKRRLKQQLNGLQDRIHIMVATQEALKLEVTPEETSTDIVPAHQNSPAESTGSSVELVEAVGPSEAPTKPKEPKPMESWRQYATMGRRKKE